MTAEVSPADAAQAKADAVAALVGELPGPGQLLRVSVTDVETGQRLATCFVNYELGPMRLRLVEDAS